ncbi:MAG: ASCH domain-containing protein [Patescibacteria group bacterium]|nr:hypothetical protein [Patescibacteria group bacterium]
MKRVHVAIMRKSWGLTQKILTGEKTVESRWYINKYRPWDQISTGETIYFKDSGEPVTVKAEVNKVEQYADLDQAKREWLLKKYSVSDLGTKEIMPQILEYIKNKRYCIIIHLRNPKEVDPFEIDKSGFGAMASWLTVDRIEEVKR